MMLDGRCNSFVYFFFQLVKPHYHMVARRTFFFRRNFFGEPFLVFFSAESFLVESFSAKSFRRTFSGEYYLDGPSSSRRSEKRLFEKVI